jgi:hypothetical protein
VARVCAPIVAQSFMQMKGRVCTNHGVGLWPITAALVQMKDRVCSNHSPSAGPPGQVRPLWPWVEAVAGSSDFSQA